MIFPTFPLFPHNNEKSSINRQLTYNKKSKAENNYLQFNRFSLFDVIHNSHGLFLLLFYIYIYY